MAVSVGDIAAMSDTVPTQSIDQNRTPDGEFDLRIHNRDKLSKEECGYHAERLKSAFLTQLTDLYSFYSLTIDYLVLKTEL